MRRFPFEFEALLTARGRRILSGKDARTRQAIHEPGLRLLAFTDVIEPRWAERCRLLLAKGLTDLLEPMDQPIPPETIHGMAENYAELLPKTVRVKTAFIDRKRSAAHARAEELGLIEMLRSDSYAAFAAAVSGRRLRRGWGMQVLSYGEGDYSGPHNDHHPEDPLARDGYLDLHLTFTEPGVSHQWLVWGHRGHFTKMRRVDTRGGVTLYRLPFWHFTTPLAVRSPEARRWVVLGTFLYAGPNARSAIEPPESVRLG